jgi:hypothetical protein
MHPLLWRELIGMIEATAITISTIQRCLMVKRRAWMLDMSRFAHIYALYVFIDALVCCLCATALVEIPAWFVKLLWLRHEELISTVGKVTLFAV